VKKIHWQAFERATFQPYPGKIALMRAIDRGAENLGRHEDPTLGWGRLAGGGLEIYDVDAGHIGMLSDPYVGTIAEKLKMIFPS
jgi:thioesterase domain-containing protein